MNLKNYLTPKQVEAYATTPKKALAISKKHWWQNTQLTLEQLEDLGEVVVLGDSCGLCAHHDGVCPQCILDENRQGCWRHDSLYGLASDAQQDFEDDPTEANYKAFIEAAKNMHKVLCGLEKK